VAMTETEEHRMAVREDSPMLKVPAELIEAVNELDEIRRTMEPLKKRDKELAPLVRTQLDVGKFEGPNCIVIVRRVAGTLDTKAIIRDMGEEWAAKYRKQPHLTVTLQRKEVPSIFSRLWGWLLVLGRHGRSRS
jgi:hypothetical protein